MSRDSNVTCHGEIEIEKEIEKEIDIKREEKTSRFVPPSLEEIKQYCSERQNSVDPESFYNFYASKGWMVGSNKMKDWKAAVITWEKRTKKPQVKQNQFNTMIHTDYDFDEIEKRLLNN